MHQRTPDLSRADLLTVNQFMTKLVVFARDAGPGISVMQAKIIIWSKSKDQPIGKVWLKGDDWVSTPWNDSFIEDPGSEADMVQAPG